MRRNGSAEVATNASKSSLAWARSARRVMGTSLAELRIVRFNPPREWKGCPSPAVFCRGEALARHHVAELRRPRGLGARGYAFS